MKDFFVSNIKITSPFILAPLAGFSDYSLRKLSNDYGANLVYTEMESCEALIYNSKETIKDISDTKLDRKNNPNVKIALQCFSGKKESVLAAIPLFEKYGDYDFLDFNCGCPVNKVIKQKAGSFWLTRTDELLDLMKEVVKKSTKPVTIKMRTGFDKEIDLVSLCKRLEEVGVKAIAIHGRTRNQFFSGPVNYELIKKVKENVSIPVYANGSIDENNGLDILNYTKCEGIMIGQRAIGYPKVFEDLSLKLQGLKPKENSLNHQIEDLKKHLNLIFKTKDEHQAASIMRSISTKYIRNYTNSALIRNKLVKCNSLKEYLDILQIVQSEQ